MSEISRRHFIRGIATTGGVAAAGALAGIRLDDVVPEASAMPLDQAPTTPAQLTGRLVYPGDPDYEAARQIRASRYSSYPRVIDYCQNERDVVNAVTWSRENGVAVRARGAAHHWQGGSSVDDGVVADISSLKQINYNAPKGAVTVGAGVTQGELQSALGPDHTVPSGSEPTVGIAGLALGGGIGLLSRSMGTTCDSLQAVRTVVPSGSHGARVVAATMNHNSDLLWASRGGGGGNFGIVTSLTFGVHPIGPIVSFEIEWPIDELAGALDAWQRWAPAADQRLGSTFLAMAGSAVKVRGVFQGAPSALQPLLAPLLGAGHPRVTTTPSSWIDYTRTSTDDFAAYKNWRLSSSWVPRSLPAAGLAVVTDFVTKAPMGCGVSFLGWGGAAAHAPKGGTAFSHRTPALYVEFRGGWTEDATKIACLKWVNDVGGAMRPYVSGAYVNVPDQGIQDFGPAYYGSNFSRLRQIKKKYDPANVFQFNQSIPPG